MKYFYDNCNVLPLKKGDGIAGKTLETYEPHFCSNIYKLRADNNGLLPAVLSANIRCSCLVICLRSIHTGNVDYLLQFLWHKSRNYLIVLESVLLTLKMCLPSFKLASGKQLGDELDVQNCTRSGIRSFKIFRENSLSLTTKGLKETNGSVPKQSMLSDLSESEIDPNQEDNHQGLINIKNTYLDADDDDDDLVIVAFYKDDATLFLLPSSSKLANAKEKINQDFDLDPTGTCKLEYEAYEGQWMKLDNDECFETCVLCLKIDKKSHIKVRVNVVEM